MHLLLLAASQVHLGFGAGGARTARGIVHLLLLAASQVHLVFGAGGAKTACGIVHLLLLGRQAHLGFEQQGGGGAEAGCVCVRVHRPLLHV